ncbi:transketolase [Cryptococcus bacillisporus CA1873]|uniref:transketolase n=1 Tax=Cryptococcus bacillisporus CA1873 TaxID=1296111 RepID=A0ABR5B3F2_CRYGA|nr:transketolase [Cryptococcus bacillisporus CA1873]|eukprot:KIR57904.1 transketolase [Cryptococcus gattii CA1873]
MTVIQNINGHGELSREARTTNKIVPEKEEQLVLNTIRCLAADLCQQYKGGHPGTVMGASAIGIALWRYEMRYNPLNPEWFNRDRFVLSAGHACLFQYIFLHLSGYEAWTLDQIKMYHSPATSGSMAAGHPEIEYPGVEVTTGPLGQGISNAVGMAIASKQLAATYNREGLDIVDNKIWCFTGDGCLQEGVGQEAISLAGHLGLDNLILVYDNNAVTVDGRIDNCFTENTSKKLEAQGWNVIDVYDGSNDLAAILEGLDKAKHFKGKPSLVNIRTVIGYSSRKADTGPAHGQALGDDEVAYVKTQLGFDPAKKFVIPDKAYEYFAECKIKGARANEEWNKKFEAYSKAYPDLYKQLIDRMNGKFAPDGWETLLPAKKDLPQGEQPTRKSSGIVVQTLVPKNNAFVAGSADLLESTFVNFDGQVEFQNPASGLGDHTGRQIRFGIREFAMVGLGNGIAAYHKGMFIPIMSTFFMFWIYAAPAARMAALQQLRFIGIATHDSIGIGEDGPTHQPIALAAFYRALPNINLIRPADAEECMGMWLLALSEQSANTPSIFALSRQPVPLLSGTDRAKVAQGAYVVYGDDKNPDITIIATGAEVARAIESAKLLKSVKKVRVVSMPSQKHFDNQTAEYKESVLKSSIALVIAIEAWASYGWARYAHASLSMHTFGHSAPQQQLYEHFGFSPKAMAEKIDEWAAKWQTKGGRPGLGDFEELLLGYTQH